RHRSTAAPAPGAVRQPVLDLAPDCLHGRDGDAVTGRRSRGDCVVNVQHRSGRILPEIDKAKATRDRALAKQALAGAESHGKHPEPQLVHEIMLDQGLHELTAAVDLDLTAVL